MEFHNFNRFAKSVKFNSARYEYGVKQESKLIVPLQKFFKDESITPLPAGSKFDFKGRGKFIELKSRTCCKNQYDTTCIGVGKVHYASKHCDEIDFYFVFQFTDGVWFWKYNREQALIGDTIYGIPHYFIPLIYLYPMNIIEETNDTSIRAKSV